MSNVIDFPGKKASTPEEYLQSMESSGDDTLDMARYAFGHMLLAMNEQGYDITNEDIHEELVVALNIINAIYYNIEGKNHFLQPVINDLKRVLANAKSQGY